MKSEVLCGVSSGLSAGGRGGPPASTFYRIVPQHEPENASMRLACLCFDSVQEDLVNPTKKLITRSPTVDLSCVPMLKGIFRAC